MANMLADFPDDQQLRPVQGSIFQILGDYPHHLTEILTKAQRRLICLLSHHTERAHYLDHSLVLLCLFHLQDHTAVSGLLGGEDHHQSQTSGGGRGRSESYTSIIS